MRLRHSVQHIYFIPNLLWLLVAAYSVYLWLGAICGAICAIYWVLSQLQIMYTTSASTPDLFPLFLTASTAILQLGPIPSFRCFWLLQRQFCNLVLSPTTRVLTTCWPVVGKPVKRTKRKAASIDLCSSCGAEIWSTDAMNVCNTMIWYFSRYSESCVATIGNQACHIFLTLTM